MESDSRYDLLILRILGNHCVVRSIVVHLQGIDVIAFFSICQATRSQIPNHFHRDKNPVGCFCHPIRVLKNVRNGIPLRTSLLNLPNIRQCVNLEDDFFLLRDRSIFKSVDVMDEKGNVSERALVLSDFRFYSYFGRNKFCIGKNMSTSQVVVYRLKDWAPIWNLTAFPGADLDLQYFIHVLNQGQIKIFSFGKDYDIVCVQCMGRVDVHRYDGRLIAALYHDNATECCPITSRSQILTMSLCDMRPSGKLWSVKGDLISVFDIDDGFPSFFGLCYQNNWFNPTLNPVRLHSYRSQQSRWPSKNPLLCARLLSAKPVKFEGLERLLSQYLDPGIIEQDFFNDRFSCYARHSDGTNISPMWETCGPIIQVRSPNGELLASISHLLSPSNQKRRHFVDCISFCNQFWASYSELNRECCIWSRRGILLHAFTTKTKAVWFFDGGHGVLRFVGRNSIECFEFFLEQGH